MRSACSTVLVAVNTMNSSTGRSSNAWASSQMRANFSAARASSAS